ncbi:MAG: mannose-6-phosphate isomerase, class I [Microbacteriaceae bacterium]|nr:mannose-6-phosphate isomerase, class I [Microbacteriaceae bacterium]
MFVGISNTPRDYAWGSTTAIPELLGVAPTGEPQAELWFGTHPGSPARLIGRSGTLAELVQGRLPFLLKVLAAGGPLSLQAHPTAAQARVGFERENAAGIPVDAPERNYKDPFPKPELIYALSDPFTALSGFRPVAHTRAVLDAVAGDARIAPLLDRLAGDDDLRSAFEWLITRGPGVEELTAAITESAQTLDGESWATVRLLAGRYPGDPGIPISLLLHTIALRPGEVLYLPAGNIHAYLGGLGVELMSASDNVLRGGLTPKHVDVPELLRVLDFRPVPPPYLAPEHPQPGVAVFRPGVPDFELTVVSPDAAARGVELAIPGGGPAIAFAVHGGAVLGGSRGHHTLFPGGAAYLEGEPVLRVSGDATVFVATTGAA